MTKEEWKKNDALMKAALEKMQLKFKRDKQTWEASVFTSSRHEVDCYDAKDWLVVGGADTPENLGEVLYFADYNEDETISNIFYGVKTAEELKIKLDLMA